MDSQITLQIVHRLFDLPVHDSALRILNWDKSLLAGFSDQGTGSTNSKIIQIFKYYRNQLEISLKEYRRLLICLIAFKIQVHFLMGVLQC